MRRARRRASQDDDAGCLGWFSTSRATLERVYRLHLPPNPTAALFWAVGNDPIPKLAEHLEERGVKVISLDLDDIDGLAAKVRRKERDAARVIVIKRTTWSERKRFNLAHELGHLVLEVKAGVDEEKAAHRFAGAFLIPADVLRAEVGPSRSSLSLGELVALKSRFGVSIQALTYRCKDLGIINQSAYAKLFKVFAERVGGKRRMPSLRQLIRRPRN